MSSLIQVEKTLDLCGVVSRLFCNDRLTLLHAHAQCSGPSGGVWERLSLMRTLLLSIRVLGWENKEVHICEVGHLGMSLLPNHC